MKIPWMDDVKGPVTEAVGEKMVTDKEDPVFPIPKQLIQWMLHDGFLR